MIVSIMSVIMIMSLWIYLLNVNSDRTFMLDFEL